MADDGPLVGAIDQGTGSSKFMVFDRECRVVVLEGKRLEYSVEVNHISQNEQFEQDAEELLASVKKSMEEVGKRLGEEGVKRIKAVGITNQRETTILWDKNTGKPLHPAIVWCDGRTAELANHLIQNSNSRSKDQLRTQCGLPIHPYFSALKLRWMIDNSDVVRTAIESGTCLFGTVDTWIIWNLTGGPEGGVFVTDVTNASRTMLMNIHTLQWDPDLCQFFGIPMSILPEIRSSSEVYGYITDGLLTGIPLSGCLGDQQAALVGQQCFSPGDAKNTYGTGCFLLKNTGKNVVMSTSGLLTTVAYQMGPNQPPFYALEGAVSVAGQCVRWLRDDIHLLNSSAEIERYANEVEDTGDVYFVPAFSGLFAPYWRSDARGLIIGLTHSTTRGHLCRAVLEAVCFRSREVLDAMNQDCEPPFTQLKVDGGMTVNKTLLQLQTDLLDITVVKPDEGEMTSLGAAVAAGLAQGVWSDLSSLPTLQSTSFEPSLSEHSNRRDERYGRWKQAVERCLGWHHDRQSTNQGQNTRRKVSPATFLLGCMTGALLGGAIAFVLLHHRR